MKHVRLASGHFAPYCIAFLLPSATKLRQGNIFTSVCQEFCPQGGLCLSACWDTHPSPLGRHPPGADSPLGSACWDRHGYCCGRYASYWNVFLFIYMTAFYFSLWRVVYHGPQCIWQLVQFNANILQKAFIHTKEIWNGQRSIRIYFSHQGKFQNVYI